MSDDVDSLIALMKRDGLNITEAVHACERVAHKIDDDLKRSMPCYDPVTCANRRCDVDCQGD